MAIDLIVSEYSCITSRLDILSIMDYNTVTLCYLLTVIITGSRSKLISDSPNPSRTPARTPRYSESEDQEKSRSKKTVPPSPSRSVAKSPRGDRESGSGKEKQCPVKGCDSMGRLRYIS